MTAVPRAVTAGSLTPGRSSDSERRTAGCRADVGERWLSRVTGGSALLLLILVALPLWTGRVPVYGDFAAFHMPIRDFYARCLARGEPFDWMPQMYAGFFLSGEGEAGCYHPWHWLLYRVLPLETAFALETPFTFATMLTGMYVFLRRKTGSAAAWLAGLTYTFATNSFQHAQHMNFIAVLAHLPWLLWLMDGAFTSPVAARRLQACVGIAFLTGSQFLLGCPQSMSFSLLAEVGYAILLTWNSRARLRDGAALFGAKALGAMIGGVQLLATYWFLGETNRSQFDPYLGSYPPTRLVQVIAPYLLASPEAGWAGEPVYFGSVAMVLSLFWLATHRRRFNPATGVGCDAHDHRIESTNRSLFGLGCYAVALTILAAWLATGRYGGLYRLQTLLPLVGQFRAPCRYVNLVGFGGAIGTALGFSQLIAVVRSGRRLDWRFLWLPWFGLGLAMVFAIAFRWRYPQLDTARFQRNFQTALLIMTAAVAALTLAARGRPAGLLILAILAPLDLGKFALFDPGAGKPVWLQTTTLKRWNAETKLPPRPNTGRILSYIWQPQRMLPLGERLINGYGGGLEPLKRLDYFHVNSLRAAEVAWYQPGFSPPSLDGLKESEPGWQQVPDPLPRFRLLSETRVSDSPREDIGTIDLDRVALVTHPLSLPASSPGRVEVLADRPGRIIADVETPARQLFTVSESFSRGWLASVDGSPVAVERVNGDFLGCVVERGAHRVEFAFRPAALAWGRGLSLVGTAIGLALVVAAKRRFGSR